MKFENLKVDIKNYVIVLMQHNIKIIQQWQSVGRVNPKLLEDRALKNCKKIGITSLQSYVTWAEIEKNPGAVDFSAYSEFVKKLKRHGLKWTPFLILGPCYATPEWFQQSKESIFATCLEHGKESKIQSIWNPYLPKYVDRFLQIFAKQYSKAGIIESILLGVSGNWGEALYPATGGFNQPKDFHTHPGWWCGDRFAIIDFQNFLKKKYKTVKRLNQTWQSNFSNFDEVKYPKTMSSFTNWLSGSIISSIKLGFKILKRNATCWDVSTIGALRLRYPDLKSKSKYLQWLDFTQWYLSSMSRWVAYWLKTARKYFAHTKIYVVSGGDGSALLGADFSDQAKLAAKYRAGIRITNQENEYAKTFVLSRWAATACKFYNAHYGTEEAWHNLPYGVVARIFDAATSRADSIYFKDLIAEDIDPRWKEYTKLGVPTPCAAVFKKYSHVLRGDQPIVEIAVLLPNTSFVADPSVLMTIYSRSMKLRDAADFDYLDEKLIVGGALKNYRFLIHLDGSFISDKTSRVIREWVRRGGVFVCGPLQKISGGNVFQRSGQTCIKFGRGYVVFVQNFDIDFLKDVIYNKSKYPWAGVVEIDSDLDLVYATRFSDKILYYNSTNEHKRKHVCLPTHSADFLLELRPHSIYQVRLRRSFKSNV